MYYYFWTKINWICVIHRYDGATQIDIRPDDGMVDMLDSKSSAAMHGGSSPPPGKS